ncbi:MAG TPA: acyltransferase [Rhizomicrobium sp.]
MTTPRPSEIKALAGARALPPLLLVLYHFSEGHGYQGAPWFDLFVCKGYLWVEFFFALSGFILIHVYSPRVATFARGQGGYLDFLKARLARLYPLHLATMLIMVVMIVVLDALAAHGHYQSIYDGPGYHPYATWGSFIANLFLVQAWHTVPQLSWNAVAWFVSVEFFLCLIFPLYLWIAQGPLWRGFALIAAGLAVLWQMAHIFGHGLDITHDFGILRGMADFAIGVGFAMLYRDLMKRGFGARPEWQFTLAQLLVFAVFVYAMYNTGWSHQALDFWVVPPMTALIFTLTFDRGLLARLFSTRPFLVLGEWSFAIYMGQTAWLQFIRYAKERLYPAMSDNPVVHMIEPAALVLVCTLWGWLLYVTIEKPANAALRRWFAQQTKREAQVLS